MAALTATKDNLHFNVEGVDVQEYYGDLKQFKVTVKLTDKLFNEIDKGINLTVRARSSEAACAILEAYAVQMLDKNIEQIDEFNEEFKGTFFNAYLNCEGESQFEVTFFKPDLTGNDLVYAFDKRKIFHNSEIIKDLKQCAKDYFTEAFKDYLKREEARRLDGARVGMLREASLPELSLRLQEAAA